GRLHSQGCKGRTRTGRRADFHAPVKKELISSLSFAYNSNCGICPTPRLPLRSFAQTAPVTHFPTLGRSRFNFHVFSTAILSAPQFPIMKQLRHILLHRTSTGVC